MSRYICIPEVLTRLFCSDKINIDAFQASSIRASSTRNQIQAIYSRKYWSQRRSVLYIGKFISSDSSPAKLFAECLLITLLSHFTIRSHFQLYVISKNPDIRGHPSLSLLNHSHNVVDLIYRISWRPHCSAHSAAHPPAAEGRSHDFSFRGRAGFVRRDG